MQKGFTIMEILIVIAIFFILTVLLATPFISLNQEQALIGSRLIVKATLSEAQSKTLSSKDSLQYGIHFETDSNEIVLFSGTSYSSGDSDNTVVPLNTRVLIEEVDLVGGGEDIIFNRITGATDQPGTILLSEVISGETSTTTVTIYATGVVE